MQCIGIGLQDKVSPIDRSHRSALERLQDFDVIGPNKLADGMVVLANETRLFVSANRKNSKATACHGWNSPESFVFCDPAVAFAFDQALTPEVLLKAFWREAKSASC